MQQQYLITLTVSQLALGLKVEIPTDMKADLSTCFCCYMQRLVVERGKFISLEITHRNEN